MIILLSSLWAALWEAKALAALVVRFFRISLTFIVHVAMNPYELCLFSLLVFVSYFLLLLGDNVATENTLEKGMHVVITGEVETLDPPVLFLYTVEYLAAGEDDMCPTRLVEEDQGPGDEGENTNSPGEDMDGPEDTNEDMDETELVVMENSNTTAPAGTTDDEDTSDIDTEENEDFDSATKSSMLLLSVLMMYTAVALF